MTMEFPWPPRALSPNSRKRHIHATSERKGYKDAWWALTKKAHPWPISEVLEITFCPPDGRKRDTDNMLASIKSGLDGMALALGVNDSQFTEIRLIRGAPQRPAGAVFVKFVGAV